MGCGKTRGRARIRATTRRRHGRSRRPDHEARRKIAGATNRRRRRTRFRVIESDTLRQVLQIGEAKVIALGGGAWIQEANRRLLDQYGCVSVWLDAPFEMCWTRISVSQEERPLGRTRDQALALYEQRRPVYELAKVHIPIREEDLEDLISRLITSFS